MHAQDFHADFMTVSDPKICIIICPFEWLVFSCIILRIHVVR